MIGPLLIRPSSRLLPRVPRRVGYLLAATAADATFARWPRSEIIVENMRRIVEYTGDPRSPRELARRSVRNYAYYLVDFIRLPAIPPAEFEKALRPADWQRLKARIDEGRGVIIVGMHAGNWDFAGALMGLRRYPFQVVTDTVKPARLNRVVIERRRDIGITSIPTEQAARGLIRALRAGDTVGVLIDRPVTPKTGVAVEFFGGTCFLPAGAAGLALRTGARVIPATMFRRADGSYQLEFDFALEPVRTGHQATDIQHLTQQIVRFHETWLGRRPDQWYMFRRMWPAGQARPIGGLALADPAV